MAEEGASEASPTRPESAETPAAAKPAAAGLCLEVALARLRSHTCGTPAPTAQSLEEAEEAEFQKLQQAEREEAERKCPSLRSIPCFYKKRGGQAQRDRGDEGESSSLQMRVFRAAMSRALHRKGVQELFDDEDLHNIFLELKRHAREQEPGSEGGVAASQPREQPQDELGTCAIDYNGFSRVREELSARGDRFKKVFAPSVFLKFPRDRCGCIDAAPFFTFVRARNTMKMIRVMLGHCDALGCGYLREKDMELFIFNLIPYLPHLSPLTEEFYPFYVFTAVRKFLFFLDPKRTRRLRIKDLHSSNIMTELMTELLHLRQPVGAQNANWFSTASALDVYSTFLELDTNQNGMLSKEELSYFGSGMFTNVFMDRLFEEYQTYPDPDTSEREMDYKGFLELVLAMDNKNSPQAIQYFWNLVDIQHQGYIDGYVINHFFRDVTALLQSSASVDDVKDEIFDMVKSERLGIITQQDLLGSRYGGTVLLLLFDAAAFSGYDVCESALDTHEGALLDPPDDAGWVGGLVDAP